MLLLGLLLAGAEPADATIAQLRADPRQWAGKTVRLTGKLDQCWGFTCDLCPAEMTPATVDAAACLPIEFDDGVIPSRLAEEALRFSHVTLTAQFDPTCMLREGVICTDRATVLLKARVETVVKRYRSSEGLWNKSRRAMLTALPEGEAATIRADLARFHWTPPGKAVRLYRADGDAERAILCTVPHYAADQPAVWPSSWEGAILSPSAIDIYDCIRLKRIDQNWYIATN
jgi:hypothetical protein